MHQKETTLEEELKTKQVFIEPRRVPDSSAGYKHLTSLQKEKEDLEEISMELELVDEEEKVP